MKSLFRGLAVPASVVKIASCLLLLLPALAGSAQYPGGVSTGTVRGWKVALYENYFSDPTGFGAGTSNATPLWWGYTGKITGNETVGYDGDTYALEYTSVFNVATAGTYTFYLNSVDDNAWLYVDGLMITSKSCCGNSSGTSTLSAGDHAVKVKFSENGGAQSVYVQVSGPSISQTDLDGRLVRNDNAKLAAWYNATNVSITANYSGTIAKANTWNNIAPDFYGGGNLAYSGGGWAQWVNVASNYNPGVTHDGDDWFTCSVLNQNGIMLLNGGQEQFMVYTPVGSLTSNYWLSGQGVDCSNNDSYGFYKASGTQGGVAVVGNSNASFTSTFSANEPKLFTGGLSLAQGAAAASTNTAFASANGGANTVSTYTNNSMLNGYGLQLGALCGSYATGGGNMSEYINYPFELTAAQAQQVNSYLAIKYGITLSQDYLNSTGGTVWSLSANSAYANRIFGIARDDNGALYQKQSASAMLASATAGFLTVSAGAVAATNAANTGTLPNGGYWLTGDNNGALAYQTTGLPAGFTLGSGTSTVRLGRVWKARLTGAPGSVTLQAGASTAFLFPANASGLSLLIDTDGDGDFTTGTPTVVPASSVSAGVATFNNVSLADGNCYTFAWSVIAPGGVANGLSLWMKADAGTSSSTTGSALSSWIDQSQAATGTGTGTFYNNGTNNYNPYVNFNGSNNYFSMPAGYANFTGGTAAYFVSRFANTTQSYSRFFDFGNGGASSNVLFAQSSTTNSLYIGGTANTSITGTTSSGGISVGTFSIYNGNLPAGAAGASVTGSFSVNGLAYAGTGTTNVPGNTTRNNCYIGHSNWSGDSYLNADMPEAILYNTALTSTQQKQVASYLAIKYALTLDPSVGAYLASDGTTQVWTSATYWNNVFGIARDDASGLLQKQATPSAGTDPVTISLGTLATTNAANAGSFAADKMFLLVGNNGAAIAATTTDIPAAYASGSCNAQRFARQWKVKNTGNTGAVQIQLGNGSYKLLKSMTNPQIAVDLDGDGIFSTGTVVLYSASKVVGNVATFNTVGLPDGAVFTLCWTATAPGGVYKPDATSGTLIGGAYYTNGLSYKLYAGNSSNYVTPMNINGASLPGTLVSTGYVHNAATFDATFTSRLNTYFGVELTGKLLVSTASSNYKFQFNAYDDMVFLSIDGTQILNTTTYGGGANLTSGLINLTAGTHDIVVRGINIGGPSNFDLMWNGGSGTTFSYIPDANLFTAPTGPSAWYSADNGTFDAVSDGTALNAYTWPDNSPNGNNLTMESSSATTYYSSNTTYIRNFNPVVIFGATSGFRNNYTNGFGYRDIGKTMFTAGGSNNTNASAQIQGSYGRQGNGLQFGMYQNGTGLYLWNYGSDMPATSYFPTAQSVNIMTASAADRAIVPTNNETLYSNGLTLTQGSYGNYPYMNGGYEIGLGDGATAPGADWNGNLSEQLFYPWTLSATERQRVNSYLALKWGITLDQSTPQSYLASDGTTKMWDASLNASFKYDITGIGRDDCGTLNQLQATSTDGADILTMGLGTLAVNNAANGNSFANDKSFLTWSSNNASLTTTGTDVPASLTGVSAHYVRMTRVWQAQVVNTPGAVSLLAGKTGLFLFTKTNGKPVLLIGSSATSFTGATVVQPTSVVNGLARFDNVSFTHGQYFTFAFVQAGPGGVTANLQLWAEANADATVSGSSVTSWLDQTGTNTFTATGTPQWNAASINFNPGVGFDGNSRFTGSTSLTNVTEAFGVAKIVNGSGVATSGAVLGSVNSTFGATYAFHTESGTLYSAGASGGYVGTTQFGNNLAWSVMNSDLSETPAANQSMKVNGLAYTNSAGGDPIPYSAVPVLGARYTENILSGSQIAEVVTYGTSQAGTNRAKVISYLALKYGLTLGSALSPVSYTASDGTVFWTGTTAYQNNVMGLGKDFASNQEQQIATSQDPTGDIVTVSTDNNFTGANGTHTTLPADLGFLVMGNNGIAATATQTTNLPANFCGSRLSRAWRVQKTNNPGAVNLQINIGTTLGSSLVAANLALLIDQDGDGNLSTGTITTLYATSFSGGLATFTGVNFDADNSGSDVFVLAARSFVPALVSLGTTSTTISNCSSGGYAYYLDPLNTAHGLIGFNPNGNSFSPTSVSVANLNNLTATGVTNSGNYYQQTTGSSTFRVSNRFNSVVAPGSYSTGGGIRVRIFYTDADTASLLADPMPGGATLGDYGWYKASVANASSVVNNMQSATLVNAVKVTPVAYGTENGIRYVEFQVTSFSTFGFYAQSSSIILSTELASFAGNAQSCDVVLTWRSGTEAQVDHYEPEYSEDQANYTKIGSVPARGSNSLYDFRYQPPSAKGYYRLKVVGQNSLSIYSPVVPVNTGCAASKITVAPNPAHERVFVSGGSRLITDASLFDVNGRLIRSVHEQLSAGIDVSALPQGMYLLRVTDSEGTIETFKIIKN